MKTKFSPFYLVLIILLVASLACSLTGSSNPTESTPIGIPVETDIPPTEAPVATEETVVVTEEPVTTNSGQVVYTYQGNILRYIVDSGAVSQVTTDAIADNYEQMYHAPQISADGSLLAYSKFNQSYIYDFASSTTQLLSADKTFLHWVGDAREYIFYRGDLTCPPVDELETQNLLYFELVKTNHDNSAMQTVLANIGGGLKFPQSVSENLQWAGASSCGCYSECGAIGLYSLASGNMIAPPIDLYAGDLIFSPDSLFLLTAQQQMYGYYESPLYIANVDYSGLTPIFSEPNAAPVDYLWSPLNGEWIAMTLYYFDADGMTLTNTRVILVRPDGSDMRVVEDSFGQLLDWSPDGTQLLYYSSANPEHNLYIYDLGSGIKTILPVDLDENGYFRADWGLLP